MSKKPLLWVNKNAKSSSLSHSDDAERINIFSVAQRNSRPTRQPGDKSSKRKTARKSSTATSSLGHDHTREPEGYYIPAHLELYGQDWLPGEHRAFAYYRQKTILKIIQSQDDEVKFWTVQVPAMASEHAIVRHLLTAIASTHEFVSCQDNHPADVFALQQCNKAIELLRNASNLSDSLVLVSCILVAAYAVLRCNLSLADATIKSGMQIIADRSRDVNRIRTIPSYPVAAVAILIGLGQRHGFKLWMPDVAFRFERFDDHSLELNIDWSRGPFHSIEEIRQSFRYFMVTIMASVARNLARGAYIDPKCLLAVKVSAHLRFFHTYCRQIADRLAPEDDVRRLDLAQLRVGICHAYLLFYTKLISPVEQCFESHPEVCCEALDLAEELLRARQRGHHLPHMDSTVNGAVFGLGLCSRRPEVRQRANSILRRQANEKDGLVHWIRAAVLTTIQSIEDELLSPELQRRLPWPQPTWLILLNLSYDHASHSMIIKFTLSTQASIVRLADRPVSWSTWPGPVPSREAIDSCLNGIVSAYRMFGKPSALDAPRGYLRPMTCQSYSVPVLFEFSSR